MRTVFTISILICMMLIACASKSISEKAKRIIPGKTTREQVIEAFGKPDEYIWGEETFSEENLPDGYYIMVYGEVGVNFELEGNTVGEVRIESNKDYSYKDKIHLGSSIEDVISFFGEPSKTITGEPIGSQDKVLYKDIEGRTGYCYIEYKDIGVRMFFVDYKVYAFYLCVPILTPSPQ